MTLSTHSSDTNMYIIDTSNTDMHTIRSNMLIVICKILVIDTCDTDMCDTDTSVTDMHKCIEYCLMAFLIQIMIYTVLTTDTCDSGNMCDQ